MLLNFEIVVQFVRCQSVRFDKLCHVKFMLGVLHFYLLAKLFVPELILHVLDIFGRYLPLKRAYGWLSLNKLGGELFKLRLKLLVLFSQHLIAETLSQVFTGLIQVLIISFVWRCELWGRLCRRVPNSLVLFQLELFYWTLATEILLTMSLHLRIVRLLSQLLLDGFFQGRVILAIH